MSAKVRRRILRRSKHPRLPPFVWQGRTTAEAITVKSGGHKITRYGRSPKSEWGDLYVLEKDGVFFRPVDWNPYRRGKPPSRYYQHQAVLMEVDRAIGLHYYVKLNFYWSSIWPYVGPFNSELSRVFDTDTETMNLVVPRIYSAVSTKFPWTIFTETWSDRLTKEYRGYLSDYIQEILCAELAEANITLRKRTVTCRDQAIAVLVATASMLERGEQGIVLQATLMKLRHAAEFGAKLEDSGDYSYVRTYICKVARLAAAANIPIKWGPLATAELL